MLALRAWWPAVWFALAAGVALGCGDERNRTADDDDGGAAGGSGGGGAQGGGGGASPTEWSGSIEWQIELESWQQIARAAGGRGELYLDDDRYDPGWHLEKISADGVKTAGGGWPLDYAPAEAIYAGRMAIGADGSFVLVGAESFGWHTAKLAPSGAVEWLRVRGTAGGGRAEGASVAPNGTITVVGSATSFGHCMLTRYLSDGTELDEVWLKELPESRNCLYVVSDDERVYLPSEGAAGDGLLHVFDAKSGAEIAATPLPGATTGAEVGLVAAAPGGGVLVGAHEQVDSTVTRHLWWVDANGAIVWEEHRAGVQGRVGARADGSIVASVVAPPLPVTTETASGELSLEWYRVSGRSLVPAGELSLGRVENALVVTVLALADGTFAVQWSTQANSPTEARHWLAKVKPEPVE